MIKLMILTTTIFFLVGCGGGSSSSSSSSDSGSNVDVNMIISELYTVYPGNKVVKNTEDVLVKIAHNDGEEVSTIVLLEGNATIIRNP